MSASTRSLLVWLASAACFIPLSAVSQSQPSSTQAAATANSADVKSIESILAATYDVISGPAGKKRDWVRFHSLFYPGARLIPVGRRAGETQLGARILSPDDYVERSAPFLEKEGFFERGVRNKVERFGNIAQVFSTYESRHNSSDAQPFQRGINGFQLIDDGTRWWILTIMWQAETPDAPIPPQYLASKPARVR